MTVFSLVDANHPTPPPLHRPIEAAVAPDHVTSAACRACHPGNHASWLTSYHRTMTQEAAPENFAAGMDGLLLTHGGSDYRVARQGRTYQVSRKPQGAQDQAYGPPAPIVLLTGSHNLQIYWTETSEGRTLGQFPFAYIIAEKKWAPMTHTFLAPPDISNIYATGDWNTTCIHCHTTQGRTLPVMLPDGRESFDSKATEFGISCEACHTGGRRHIEAHRNPVRRLLRHLGDGADDTIANPARMSAAAAALACGQCHSIWAFNNAVERAKFEREGGKYRAGGTDLDLRWVAQPRGPDNEEKRAELLRQDPHFFSDSFWSDGRVRVTGRELNALLISPCYQGGDFSCLSCHEMHPERTDPATLSKWRNDQLRPDMETDSACLQCHKKFATNLTAHTHHQADSSGSRCYNCHMPHSSYGLLRAIRSHTVSSPTVRESLEHGRPNACNLCHLDQSLGWTAANLQSWYGQEMPKLGRDDRDLSAAAQWLLKGDAGQRSLVVWHMGWSPAQRASNYTWLYPFLIVELNDPYAAVRFAAWKSLQSLAGFSGLDYDFTADDRHQKEAAASAYQKWWHEVRLQDDSYRAQTILESNGMFRQDVFDRLLEQRSKRKIILAE